MQTRGARTLHNAPFVPRAAYTGAPGDRVPRDLGPSLNPSPGANSSSIAAAGPGPARGAGGEAAAGTQRPLSAQLCSPRSVLRPARPCRGRPARYLQGARAAAASPSRARKLPRLWSPARSWAGGGAARAAPPAPRRAPSSAALGPHRPQLPKPRAVTLTLPPRPAPSSRPLAVSAVTFSCSRSLFNPLADASVTSGHRVLVHREGAAGTDRLRDRGVRAGPGREGAVPAWPGEAGCGTPTSRVSAGHRRPVLSLAFRRRGAFPYLSSASCAVYGVPWEGCGRPAGIGAGSKQPEL